VLKPFATKNFLARYAYNPNKANKLLDEAGFPRKNGGTRFTLKMTVPSDFPAPQLQDAIAGFLNKIGIKVDANVADFTTNWARVFQWTPKNPWRGYDLSVMPGMWTAPVSLESYYTSSRYQPGTLWSNAWAYRNPKVDKLLHVGLTTAGASSVRALTAAQEQLAADLPTFPLTSDALYEVAAGDLKGLPMGAGLHLEPPLPPFNVRRTG
jgi:peptide/nickel transport system substrate-binding protein